MRAVAPSSTDFHIAAPAATSLTAMPTPSVVRSQSPVAVSTSCLPNSDESTSQLSLDRSDAPFAPSSSSFSDEELSSKLPVSPGHATAADAADAAPHTGARIESSMDADAGSPARSTGVESENERAQSAARDIPSQASSPSNAAKSPSIKPASPADSSSPPFSPAEWEVASKRVNPTVTSSLFRPFSKFVGTQRSDKSVYNVEVELKHVDMAESFCCGYLKIEGLTEHLPTITTYFEGEIIGTKYTFQTQHASWGAGERTDMTHWSRFPAFAPLKSAAKSHRHHDPGFANRDHLFMRWKEQFLVPDYRQRDLPGASFEGFYYIVFDQRNGALSGIYFHSKSERYQRLELQYQREPWFSPAVEFR